MKKFKELKQRIFESGEHTFGGGFGDTFVKTNANSAFKDYGKGVFELDKEDNLDRVNAFLKTFFNKAISDYGPELGVLKSKLNLLGLDFNYDKNTKLTKGPNTFELNRFGGAFGKSPTTPHNEFDRENGFPEGMAYNLNINVGMNNSGLYDINANITQTGMEDGDTETDEQEFS